MGEENYRNRCYKNYVSRHFVYNHKLSKDEFNFFQKVYKKRYSAFIPKDKNAKIIDIACGSGHFLYFLQTEGYANSYGIDISEEQIKVAKKIGVKNVQRADLFEYLPHHIESFDMVIANDIIEHFKKDEIIIFLDLIYRSLKKNGILLIGTNNAMSLFSASGVFFDFTHEVGFTPNSLAQIMRVCNFNNVRVYGESPIVYNFLSAIRRLLWFIVTSALKTYITIERGTGRGFKKHKYIFEPRMFAIGEKSE